MINRRRSRTRQGLERQLSRSLSRAVQTNFTNRAKIDTSFSASRAPAIGREALFTEGERLTLTDHSGQRFILS